MNEQAIIDSYNLFVGSGYKKSLQEFKQLLASNPEAVNDSYGLFQQNGYRKSLDEYKSLMGIGAAVESPMAVEEQPKKKGATVSPFVAGGSELTKFEPSTGQIVQDTPDFAKPGAVKPQAPQQPKPTETIMYGPMGAMGLQRTKEYKPEFEGKSLPKVVGELGKTFAKGVVKFPADVLETAAIATTAARNLAAKTGLVDESSATELRVQIGGANINFFQAASEWKNLVNDFIPTDKDIESGFWGQAATALGQMVPVVLTGGIAGGGRAIAKEAGKKGLSMQAVANYGKDLVSRMGSAQGVLTVSQVAAPSYEQAKRDGATENEAIGFALQNAIMTYPFEMLPVNNLFKRLDNVLVGNKGVEVLKRAIVGGAEEGITEGIQNIYENVTADAIYGTTRGFLDGVGESTAVGGTVGAIMNGLLTALLGRRARATSEMEIEQLDKSIEEVQQKVNQVDSNNKAIEKTINEIEETKPRKLSYGSADYNFLESKDGKLEYADDSLTEEQAKGVVSNLTNSYKKIDFTIEEVEPENPYQPTTYKIIGNPKTIQQDAIQEQAAGQVPVQPGTTVSQEVAQGEPQAEPQGVTQEGQVQEEVDPLKDVESTTNALANALRDSAGIINDRDSFNAIYDIVRDSDLFSDVREKAKKEGGGIPQRAIAEKYHESKANGTNPDFVKLVENAFIRQAPTKQEAVPAIIQPEIDTIEAQRRQELEANKGGLDKPYYIGETEGPTLGEFINQEYDAKIEELKAKAVPQQVQEVVTLSNKSIDDLERRLAEIEDSRNKEDRNESNKIEKELENREWKSVLNSTLEEIPGIVDSLIEKEKKMPNGFGTFIEPRDARETKQVAAKYSREVSQKEAKKDFKDAFFGNPSSWYADGLKMRESVRSFVEQGGTFKDLLKGVQEEFESDGFSEEDAATSIKNRLDEVSRKNISEQQVVTPQQIEKQRVDLDMEVKALEDLLSNPNEEPLFKKSDNDTKFGEPADVVEDVVRQINELPSGNVTTTITPKPQKPINIDDLESRADAPVKRTTFDVIKGIPAVFSISDQLRIGNVTNPNTGNVIDKLFGGLGFGFTKGHEGFAWANTTKDEAQNLVNRAVSVYNNNKALFDDWWAKNPEYNGLVPLNIAKMAEGSIMSNEALYRVIKDNFASFPKKNKVDALNYLTKNRIPSIIDSLNNSLRNPNLAKNARKSVEKRIKALTGIQQKIKADNLKSVDQLLDPSFYTNLSLPVRAELISQLTIGSPNKPGEQKASGLPGENTVPRALLGVDQEASLSAKAIGKDNLNKVSLSNATDIITEPSMRDVEPRQIIAIYGVDVLNPAVKETVHPNYKFGINGRPIGVLENSVSIQEAYPFAYTNILESLIAKEVKTGEKLKAAPINSLINEKIPVGIGLPNLEFIGAISQGIMSNAQKLSAWINKSFPSVIMSTDAETFANVLKSEGVRVQLKGDEVVYGVTVDGDIYINPDVHNSDSALFNTTIHEFGHVWLNFLETTAEGKTLLNRGVDLVKKTGEYQDQLKKFNGNQTKAANEALAILIGNRGETIVNASLKSKFQEWLLGMWKYVKDKFKLSGDLTPQEIQDLTLDQFLGTAIADLFSGKSLPVGEIQLKKLKNPEAAFSKSDSIDSIVQRGRANGFSEESINVVLQKRGFTQEAIDAALGKAVPAAKKVEVTEEFAPGYNRVLNEIFGKDGVVSKSRRRGRSEEEAMQNAIDYLEQDTKVYENATDVQREAMVRNIRKEFKKREKAAPSAERVLGQKKDVVTIEVDLAKERDRLINEQIKAAKSGAKSVSDAIKAITKYFNYNKYRGNLTRSDLNKILNIISGVKDQSTLDKAADKIFLIIKNANSDIIEVSDSKARNSQIRLEVKSAREAKGDLNTKRKALAARIIAARRKGTITAAQARALVNRISKVNLDNPIMVDRLIEYTDKVFDDANYAADMAELRKLQKQAKSRNHTSMSNVVKQFTSINPENIPLDRIQDYKEALDFLNNRTPFYGNMNDVFDEMLSYQISEEFDAIKTKEALEKKYKDIMANKVKTVEDYVNLIKDINSFKRRAFQLLQNEEITQENYDDLIKMVGKDQAAVEKEYEKEITKIKKDLIAEIKNQRPKVSRDFSNAENDLIRKYLELSDADLQSLSPEDLFVLNDLLENISNGEIDVSRFGPIVSKAYTSSGLDPLAKQINKSKFDKSSEEGRQELSEQESSFWEGLLGMGRAKAGALQKLIISPFNRAIGSYEKFSRDGLNEFLKLKNKYKIDSFDPLKISKDMHKIGMLTTYLQEYMAQFDSKNEGVKDIGKRDWFKEIINNRAMRDNYSSGKPSVLKSIGLGKSELDIIEEIWKSLPKNKDGNVDPKAVYDSYMANDGKFFTKKQKAFFDDVMAYKAAEITPKQKFANELSGASFKEIPFHMMRVRLDKGKSQIAPSASSENNNVRITAGTGKERVSEKVGAVMTNFEKLFISGIEQTGRDYFLSNALQDINNTLAGVKKIVGDEKIELINTISYTLSDALKFEFDRVKTNFIFRNLLSARAAQTLLRPIRTAVELGSTLISYPVRAKTLSGYKSLFGEQGAMKKLLEFTDSPMLLRNNISKAIDINDGSIEPQSAFTKATNYLSGLPERTMMVTSWMPTFKSEFKNITGIDFDMNKFNNSEAYREKYGKAIRESSAAADAQTEKIIGPTTKAGQRREVRIAPKFLANLVGSEGTVSKNTATGQILGFFSNYPFRESTEFLNGFREAAEVLNDEGALSSLSQLQKPLGVALNVAAYSFLSSATYALGLMLLGDDEDEKRGEDLLKSLLTGEGLLEELKSNAISLAGSQYAAGGKAMLQLAATILIESTDDEKLKAKYKKLLKDSVFIDPLPVDKALGFKGEEEIAGSIGKYIPPFIIAYARYVDLIGTKNEIKEIYDKVERKGVDALTEDEGLKILALNTAFNSAQLVLNLYGTSLPEYNYIKTYMKKLKEEAGVADVYKGEVPAKKSSKGGGGSKAKTMNKTDMKRYFPEQYDQLYGPNSPGYEIQQQVKEFEKQQRDLEKSMKDQIYGVKD